MKKNYKKVLFEGDEVPKVNIICDVLHEGLRAEFRDAHNRRKKGVVLLHCNSSSYIEYKDILHIYSSLVPYGIAISMFFTGENIDVKEYDEIVYMEPYPFTLGEKIRAELDEINNNIKRNTKSQFKIMFYRNINQKSGIGDIVGIDQALENAPDYIKKNLSDVSILKTIEYCVYKTPKDLIDIVHGGCGNLSVLVSVCAERFRQYKNKIKADIFFGEYGDYKEILEFKSYDKYASLLQPESINRVTKFRKVKGSNDVVRKYVLNYTLEFQDLLLDLIEEVYIEIVRDICFWDLEKDIASLKEGAKKRIEKSLLATSNAKEKCPQFEADYNNRIRNMLKLDTQFEEKAISLVNKEMMEYLYAYLRRKEKLLSKPFSLEFDNGN